jgi:enamine deaminase RidA (YjgF/YER057c/UK114 family)
MKFIAPATVAKAVGPYTPGVMVSPNCDLLFISGQLPTYESGEMINSSSSIGHMVKLVLSNVIRVVEGAGGQREHICSVTLLVACDLRANWAEINTAYEEAMGGHKPARFAFQAVALPGGALIEAAAVAAIPK